MKSFEECETNITQYFTYRRFPDFTLGLVTNNTFALYYTLLSYKNVHYTNIFREIILPSGQQTSTGFDKYLYLLKTP